MVGRTCDIDAALEPVYLGRRACGGAINAALPAIGILAVRVSMSTRQSG